MAKYLLHLRKRADDFRTPDQLLEEYLGSTPRGEMRIIRESIDARKKHVVMIEYQCIFEAEHTWPKIQADLATHLLEPWTEDPLPSVEPDLEVANHPVIVGFGPAGMFLALQFARLGLNPMVIEQGEPVDKRWVSVQSLWEKGELNPSSNMHFGEGGAGTFSDGKLATSKRSPLHEQILKEFHFFGGPKDILYRAKPHIGTDYLQKIVKNIRQEICSLGGEIHFNHTFDGLRLQKGRVEGIKVNGVYHPVRQLFLCPGNSARSTFQLLYEAGVALEAKPMAVGFRLEHPRDFIDDSQYGAWRKYLPAADYRLAAQVDHRGVYSFCMCPGGSMVCTATEPGGVVTNGMSYHCRSGQYSNSALVVSVGCQDYPSAHPLAGLEFQRFLEKAAYGSSQVPFTAYAQWCADFVRGELSHKPITCTYKPGVIEADLNTLFPPFLSNTLRKGLAIFDQNRPGLIAKGVLVGVESRTSSPVRLVRNSRCESINTEGLFVFGEGAGYAGGIMTSALDAYKFSLRVKKQATKLRNTGQ